MTRASEYSPDGLTMYCTADNLGVANKKLRQAPTMRVLGQHAECARDWDSEPLQIGRHHQVEQSLILSRRIRIDTTMHIRE